jgi:hypothetical protein
MAGRPQIVLSIAGNIDAMYFDISVIVLLISIALSAATHFTSSIDRPPKYRSPPEVLLVLLLSFVFVAKEVVSVMKTIGVISDLSDSLGGAFHRCLR